MFFKKQTRPVYSFIAPYVSEVDASEAALWIDGNPYPRPDPETLIKIQNHLLTWMGRENLILAARVAHNETAYYLNHKRDTSSLAYLIGETNFLSLTSQDYYSIFKQALFADASNKITTRLASLPMWLGTLFAHDDLNYLVHATYVSAGYIDQSQTSLSWQDIHKDLPFMWILLVANSLIHTYVRPITETIPPLSNADKK